MFEFLKIQFSFGNITAEKLQTLVNSNKITQEQYSNIIEDGVE